MSDMSRSSSSTSSGSVSIDLTAYIAPYHGNTLYARLLFIAKNFPSHAAEAYRLLSMALKSGNNSRLYCDIFSDKSTSFGSSFEFDKSWVDETERKNHMQLERLEADFTAAKSSMIKESIRVAYSDLARHHSEVGNLQEALRAFTRIRDYTSMPRHTEEMVMHVCTLAIDMNRPHLLSNFITSSVEEGATSSLVRDKLRALAAIQALSQKDFAGASRRFSSVESHISCNFGTVVSGEDVALGAVVCGIAGLERGELQSLLLDNQRFKPLLDLVPALRQLMGHFLAGRYAEVKAALGPSGEVYKRVNMDLHLHTHAEQLFATIHDKLVLQYFRPYNAIRMSRAADDMFPEATTAEERAVQEDELEAHVRKLIEMGSLQARLDAGCTEGSTLRRVWQDDRALALQAVCTAATDSSVKIKQSILRLSLLQHSYFLSTRKQQRGGDSSRDKYLESTSSHMDVDLE
jgi:COP9 signalosome complex subunit 1